MCESLISSPRVTVSFRLSPKVFAIWVFEIISRMSDGQPPLSMKAFVTIALIFLTFVVLDIQLAFFTFLMA